MHLQEEEHTEAPAFSAARQKVTKDTESRLLLLPLRIGLSESLSCSLMEVYFAAESEMIATRQPAE